MGRTDSSRRTPLMVAAATLLAALAVTTAGTPDIATAALEPDPAAAIAGGPRHQCAVLADQTVQCWGANDRGQLGDGTTVDSMAPVTVQGLTDVVAIDAGTDFSCALTAGGTVGCWGRNTSGSLGDPGAGAFETTPTFANGLVDAVEVTVGETHACTRLASGSVFCWGDNDDQQLGDGTSVDTATPVAAAGLADAIQISAGIGTTCAVRATRGLVCWGFNGTGMFGNGASVDSAVPISIPEAGLVEQVDVGLFTTCVIAVGGWARCAGLGPLGDGASSDSETFVDVDLPPVLDISVGGDLCAIVPDGSVWCWGPNLRSLDGTGREPFTFGAVSGSPAPVEGAVHATSIDAVATRSCLGTIDGRVVCWGTNVGGELQIDAEVISEPGTVVDGVEATALAVGPFAPCAITPSASVSCWGFDFGLLLTLGPGFVGDDIPNVSPSTVAGVSGAVDLDTAGTHSCAALSDGSVSCWGLNIAGELGFAPLGPINDPDRTFYPPQVVDGVANASEVAVGSGLTCATPGSGAACWGAGLDGQRGDGTTTASVPSPSAVSTPPMTTNVDLIAAGESHACARLAIAFFGEFVHCWGSNGYGQLGDGSTDDSSTPINTGVAAPKSIDVSSSHTCAIDFSDSVYCWGQNDVGQVDVANPSVMVDTPHAVAGIPATPVQVSAGSRHSCALLMDATVACWGSNVYGQTGHPNLNDSQSPQLVPGLTGVKEVAAGMNNTCAILSDSSVTCWGYNAFATTGALPFVVDPTDMGIASLLVPAELRTEPIFHPIEPARLLDTRPGGETIDGEFSGDGRVSAGTQTDVQVTDRADVPAGATFAIVNITAVQPSTTGFVTAHPCLSPPPNVAQLNYAHPPDVGSINLGNESIVQLSPDGTICLFTSSATHLTMDVVGYGTDRGGYRPVTPARILETRPGESTIDGEFELGTRVVAGSEVTLDVAGRAGVPATASAAVLYVAAVRPDGVGFVTAYPCDGDPPLASSLNFGTIANGQALNRGNEIVAPLDDDGRVCIFASEITDLTVDVMGSIDEATTYEVRSPVRILESRPGLDTLDGMFELGAPVGAGTEIELEVAGRAGVPDTASTATLNITAVRPTGVGFLTAHPCSTPRPTASSLNFTSTPTSGSISGGNEIVAPLSATGTVCLYVSTTTHLTVDAVGFS